MIESVKYNPLGGIEAIIDGVGMTVPDDMENRDRLAIAAWEADGNVIEPYIPPEPAPVIRQAVVVAMAELVIIADEITGVETSVNIGAAMALDVNVFWIFFAADQPDAAYLPFVQSPGFDVDVTDRQTGYFEVSVTDRATQSAAVPASLSITVQRVQ
jgi:hypothetical protein